MGFLKPFTFILVFFVLSYLAIKILKKTEKKTNNKKK